MERINRRDRIRPCAILGLLCYLLPLVSGCGGESVAEIRGAVKGNVTLDGQPLKQGSIRFIPAADTKGPVSGSAITDGAYSISLIQGAAIGKNRIEINATKLTGKKIKSIMNDSMVDETEEAIPKEYNTKSTLEKEIQKGENEIDFDLKSK